jgi:hypothetical protein
MNPGIALGPDVDPDVVVDGAVDVIATLVVDVDRSGNRRIDCDP